MSPTTWYMAGANDTLKGCFQTNIDIHQSLYSTRFLARTQVCILEDSTLFGNISLCRNKPQEWVWEKPKYKLIFKKSLKQVFSFSRQGDKTLFPFLVPKNCMDCSIQCQLFYTKNLDVVGEYWFCSFEPVWRSFINTTQLENIG